MNFKRINYLIFIILVGGLIAGCGPSREKTNKASQDWSRGVELGQYVNGSIGLSVSPENQRISMIWPFNPGDTTRFRLDQLNQQAEIITHRELVFPGQVRAPRLVQAANQRLHLFWSSRQAGGRLWELWYTLLDESGEPLGEPVRMSQADVNVGYYEIASDNRDGAVAVWGTGGQGALYLGAVSPEGVITQTETEVISQGESPSLRIDQAGSLHLAWLKGTQIFYANLANLESTPVTGTLVADIVLGTGDSLAGPVLGQANGWVYVLWSIASQSGMEAGSAHTDYVAFEPQHPLNQPPQSIWISPGEELPFVPYSGPFALTQFVNPPQFAYENTDFIMHPSTMPAPGDELAVVVTANQQFRLDQHLQVAVLLFDQGKYTGYSYVTKSEGISDFPVIYNAPNGQLYVAWREAAGGRNVYFATTAPAAVADLDRLQLGDFISAVLQGGIESFVSIALTPIVGFGWLLPGLIVLGIWKLIRENETITDPITWIPFSLAVIIYEGVKFISLPTIVTYVPFSAWLAVPTSLDNVLRIGTPIAITIVAFWAANWISKKRSASALLFYVAFGLIDAIFFLAIYGVNFLGVF